MPYYKVKRFANRMWTTSPENWMLTLKRKLFGLDDMESGELRNCKCIFFLSTGRVGTQTLAALLGLDRHLLSHHEPNPPLFGLSQSLYKTGLTTSNLELSREAFLIARRHLLEQAIRRRRTYVETSPQVTFLAPLIEKILPKSQFVHLIRNPYEVVRSGVRRNWYSGSIADRTRITPHPESEFYRLWDNMTPFEKNIWLWRETNEWIADFLDRVSSDRKLSLRHEDFLLSNSDDLAELYNFVGAIVPSRRKLQNVLTRRLNAQKAGNFPYAHQWTPEMKQQLFDIAANTASRFGYDILV